jgi:general secretion pathway protein A
MEVLEEIRLLGNFEGGADKYLQILLLGQSELDDLLNRQDLRQFRQRIALRLYIDPLTATEVPQYVFHRWAKAGGRGAPPFTQEAIRGVTEWSQGIPRLVNSICDTALLMAYGDESPLVGIDYVRDAAMNLAPADASALPPAVPPRPVAVVSAEKSHSSWKLAAQPVVLSNLPEEDLGIPTLARYGDPRANPSLLKRLADRFGIGH